MPAGRVRSPVRLFSFLVPKRDVAARVSLNERVLAVEPRVPDQRPGGGIEGEAPADPGPPEDPVAVPLVASA